MSNIPISDYRTIIGDPEGAETLIRWADQYGKSLKDMGLSTNQIRALFGEVRQIQAQWNVQDPVQHTKAARRLVLLKPKMAYRSRKERGRAVQELVDVLTPALDEVIHEKDGETQSAKFERFVEFFEAILAYHKAYGGN